MLGRLRIGSGAAPTYDGGPTYRVAGESMTVTSLADAASKPADVLAAPGATPPFAPFEWMIAKR